MSPVLPRVYIETTVVSYLTAWPSHDVIIAGHQERTRRWWNEDRPYFNLLTSDTVLTEAADGDPNAAKERLEILKLIALLAATPPVLHLAERLIKTQSIPANVPEDALHVVHAAVEHIPFLLTWNMRHLANPVMQPRIREVCESAGFIAPQICTPDLLRRPVT